MTHTRKTVDTPLIMSFSPCEDWPESRVLEMVPEPVPITTLLRNKRIPPQDRLWVALRNDFFDDRELRHFACDYAQKALRLIQEPDRRSVKAIEVSRRYADGQATDEELAAAGDAAKAAAWDAAVDAAWAAARAAWRAAWAAAVDAAWAAARAAGDAAGDAAWAAAWEWQCEHLALMAEADELRRSA